MSGESSKRKFVPCPKPTVTPRPLGRIIPGPAGVIQKAIHRRGKGKGLEEDYVPTQEFLLNAFSEPVYDDTWGNEPWLTIENMGYCDFDGFMNVSTILELEDDWSPGVRSGLMAGVVKKYKRGDARTRDGIWYGGFYFTDKSGSIQAQICHIDVQNGDAIVIQNCAIFNFNQSRYDPKLNIVPDNLVYLAKSAPPPDMSDH